MADPFEPVGPPADDEKPPPFARRLLWMALIALAGAALVAGTAYFLRALLFL